MLPIKDHAKDEAEDLEDFEATEADPEEKVKRDVRSVSKFIEVALVLDKAMFDKRPHSSRKDVIHDAIQVANIADLVSVFCGYAISKLSKQKTQAPRYLVKVLFIKIAWHKTKGLPRLGHLGSHIPLLLALK